MPRTYGRGSTSALQARLETIADVLDLGHRTFFEQGDVFNWQPMAGSVGRWDHGAARKGDKLAGMATYAPSVTSVMGRTAAELLGALGTLYRAGGVFGAVEPLVRAVLENCAAACWVLDPQATGSQRAARVLGMELTNLRHDRSATEHLVGTDNDTYRTLDERLQQVAGLAEELFPPFSLPKGNDRFTVGGEHAPTFTQLVERWAKGPGRGAISGRGLYGILSSGTHPRALAVRLNWHLTDKPTIVEHEVSIDYLGNLATAALSPFYAVLVSLASYHGWLGNRPLGTFEADYEAVMPQVFGETGSEDQ